MILKVSTLPDSPDLLKEFVLDLQGEIVTLREMYARETGILLEQIRLLRAQLYGRKSEKITPTDGPQPLPLFDMPEPEGLDEESEEEIQVPGHTRKKRGRKPLPENLRFPSLSYGSFGCLWIMNYNSSSLLVSQLTDSSKGYFLI
jgi:transposase